MPSGCGALEPPGCPDAAERGFCSQCKRTGQRQRGERRDGGWQAAVAAAVAAACRAVVFSGAAAAGVATGPGRGGALSWAGGAEGPGGAERDRSVARRVVRPWQGPSLVSVLACAVLSGQARGRFGALGKAGLLTPAAPLVRGARGFLSRRRALSGGRAGGTPGTWESSPGRASEVYHQPPSRSLRRSHSRSSIREHRDLELGLALIPGTCHLYSRLYESITVLVLFRFCFLFCFSILRQGFTVEPWLAF